jgi:site-specific recombinase XerD
MEYPQLDQMSKAQMRQILQSIFQGAGDMNIKGFETISLQAAAEGFIAACRVRKLSDHTIEQYDWTIRKFIEHAGNLPMSEVTPNHVAAYLGSIEYSAKTVLNRHVALAAFWTWALKMEYVEKHVVRLVDKPRVRQVIVDPFTEDDINKILSAVARTRSPRRNRAMVYLLLDCGIRASELLGLQRENIDFEAREIKVLGKGDKERVIPFSKQTAEILQSYLKTIVGQPFPLDRHSLSTLFDTIGKYAGVKKTHPHRFRHTFAINYLRNGGDVYTLAKCLGHTTLEMVRRYLAISQNDIQQAHRRASPVKNMGLQPSFKPVIEVRAPREQSEKARDMEIRRKAKRLGYTLSKDTHHNRTDDHQGGYMVLNAFTGEIEAGHDFELTLEQVNQFLGDE